MMQTACLLFTLLLAGCASYEIRETHFFHPGPARNAKLDVVEGATVISDVMAVNGETIGFTYVSAPEADVEILYFGGDSFRIDDFGGEVARFAVSLRVNLFMIDYRGYGRSGGTPTIDAIQSDALAAFDHLKQRAGDRPIVVHGFSLGSFIAGHVAANRPVDGLVLESAAPDVRQWANAQIPLYARAVVRVRIAPRLLRESNIESVRKHQGSLLLMTGSLDTITPPRFATSLLASSRSTDRTATIIDGARHGNVLAAASARTAYEQFLKRLRTQKR